MPVRVRPPVPWSHSLMAERPAYTRLSGRLPRGAGSSPAGTTSFIFPDGAAVAQLTVNQLVVGSNPTQGAIGK